MEKFLKVKELAKALGVSPSKIYKWSSEGKIPRIHHIRHLIFSECDVLEWLKSQEPVPIPQTPKTRTKRTRRRPGNQIAQQARKAILG